MEPKNSPWGNVDHCETLAEGVFAVSTAGHGGFMVKADQHKLSSQAIHYGGEKFGKFLCFEEDCAWAIAAYELRKLGVDVAPKVTDEIITKTIIRWFPEYAAEVGLSENI